MGSIIQFTTQAMFAVFINIVFFSVLFHIFEYLEFKGPIARVECYCYILCIYWAVPLFFSVLLLLGWAKFTGVDYFLNLLNGKPIALILTILMSISLVSFARILSVRKHSAIRNFILVQIVLGITLTIFVTIFGYLTRDIWLVAVDNLAKMVERDTPWYALVSSTLAFFIVELYVYLFERRNPVRAPG